MAAFEEMAQTLAQIEGQLDTKEQIQFLKSGLDEEKLKFNAAIAELKKQQIDEKVLQEMFKAQEGQPAVGQNLLNTQLQEQASLTQQDF